MEKFAVLLALESVGDARAKWNGATAKFNAEVEAVMGRLLREAAVNYMSIEEVAKAAGLTRVRVRRLMLNMGLSPSAGKGFIAKRAAEALAENAALMGVEPREFDLMSPLAYLPMGSELRRFLETPVDVEEMTEGEYARNKARLLASLTMGVEAEQDNPDLRDMIADLTHDQLYWLASWLAGDGFGAQVKNGVPA